MVWNLANDSLGMSPTPPIDSKIGSAPASKPTGNFAAKFFIFISWLLVYKSIPAPFTLSHSFRSP